MTLRRLWIYRPDGEKENEIEMPAGEWPDLPPGYVAEEAPRPEPEPPAAPVQLTPREFMSRLPLGRQEAITAAAVAAAVQGNAAPLNWLFRMLGAVYVDPAEPETAGGVAAMEASGLITAEEAAALLA